MKESENLSTGIFDILATGVEAFGTVDTTYIGFHLCRDLGVAPEAVNAGLQSLEDRGLIVYSPDRATLTVTAKGLQGSWRGQV
ncbi:hypothetical protein [Lewinella sp. IMCC34183]|uniref:hypothetical protein n=1 Tax=Lewinella sp. IMCC34183 TaxID=2248762 RepID=UPI000E24050E|nr:hypothetical protein [Lewinella sp. IMCC34183]